MDNDFDLAIFGDDIFEDFTKNAPQVAAENTAAHKRKIPVVMVSGFLGAGKTSLLNNILRDSPQLKIGAIVNDFGKINIDNRLVSGTFSENQIELSNGCICCMLGDNGLREPLDILANENSELDAILVEASGIAEPYDLMNTLRYSGNQFTFFGGNIYLIDAKNFELAQKEFPTHFKKCLKTADILLITKTDLVSPEKVAEIRQFARELNARALILASRIADLDAAARDKWTTIYASFVQHAWNPDTRAFRNFMAFDRSWCEDTGSEDSNGRTLWALGVTANEAPQRKHREWATALFDQTAHIALDFGSPRAQAFAILGAASIDAARPGHGLARNLMSRFGDQLLTLLDAARRPEWKWFEIVLAYDNARLPEALLRAGVALGRDDLIACGIETLEWIVTRQTSPDGHFRAVGTESFGREFAEPLPFDQQPLEAQATIDACAAAFEATGDRRWVDEAMRAYRWYLGANELDLPLSSGADGGCYDGLMPTGVNRNQGAESILALQLASCAISALSKQVPTVAQPERRATA